jgi:thymidylate synthase (FAD)
VKTTLVAATAPATPHKSEPRFLTAEELIVYCARVSNPSNQNNVETGEKLLRYCISHSHWSVFETASLTVEVETSRAIAAQILRHRSFTFQEFSQRYAVATEFEPVELRTQDLKNRQGSGDVVDPNIVLPFHGGRLGVASFAVQDCIEFSEETYKSLISAGVSKETARMVLPLCTRTTLYITGSVRSWIHYFEQRCSPHAQKEHRLIAEEIRDTHFKLVFPSIHAIITTKP